MFADSISAPGEGFDIVTKGQVEELRDEGKDEEAEKMDDQLHSATGRGLPWKKEHEAMVVYYRSKLNGMLLDSHDAGLEIVYVPYIDKIVLITGHVPVSYTHLDVYKRQHLFYIQENFLVQSTSLQIS